MLLLLTAPLSAAPVTTWQGRTRVRERALLDGIPVADAEVIREFGPTGVRVHRAGRIPAPRTDAIAVLSAEDARSRVEDVALAEPALAWLEGRLVWEVPLYGVVTGVEGVAWVDAHDGRVVTRWRRASSLGRVYAVAPEPEDLVDVTLVDRDDPGVLESAQADVYSLTWNGAEPVEERLAVPDEAGDFLYDPGTGDDAFSEVNAFHHLDAAATRFAEEQGYTTPEWVEVVVNWEESPGTPYDNAWSEYTSERHRTLVFGEGAVDDFAHDPQIVIHEYGHQVLFDESSFSENTDYPFELDAQGIHVGPGALTEGLPDYFGASFLDDPVLGSHSRWELRDADNDHDCVSWSMGEAHTDASVASGAGWALREALGAELADAMVYGSLGLLSGSPTFAEWGEALLAAADTLVENGAMTLEERAKAEEVLEGRRLFDCGREIEVADAESVRFFTVGAEYAGEGACELMRGLDVHMTPPYQVRLPVPEAEVTAVELGFAWSPWDPEGDAIGDGDLDYTVLWRVGAPVELETERMEFAGYAFDYAVGPSAWDGMAEGSPATVRIDPPDGDLYVTVLHANCPVTWLDVDVAWEHPIPEEPRACGCETGAGPGWLGLVGLLLRRRR